MNIHKYRKISKIIYNNKRFQVFMDEKNRYAFLEIDKDNNYSFPHIEDFIGLIEIFSKKNNNEYYYRKIENKQNKFVFKASVLVASGVIACSSLLFNALKEQKQITNTEIEQVISIADDYKEELPKEISQEDITINIEEQKDLSYITDDMYNIYDNQIDIYNSKALNLFLEEKNITINDLEEAINNNQNINDEIKNYLIELSKNIMETYPNIDMRLFYENIKRLNIVYESEESIKEHGDDLAWYNCETGEIHLNESIKLDKGSKDLMIFRHEAGHMISQAIIPYEDSKELVVITKNGAYGEYLQEAIDVIITSEPFKKEYDFTNYGYAINTNELEAIINAIPNFDMSVLVNQDVYNITAYLDEVNPNKIPAYRLVDLMDIQTIAYNNIGTIETEPEEFNEIYEYIANTYINNCLNPNMSYDEIIDIEKQLIDNLNKNLGYTGNLTNYQIIEDKFIEYMEINNINHNKTMK